jgi:hypothetical protein
MPHKYNADRRHHIPRTCYKVTNWTPELRPRRLMINEPVRNPCSSASMHQSISMHQRPL